MGSSGGQTTSGLLVLLVDLALDVADGRFLGLWVEAQVSDLTAVVGGCGDVAGTANLHLVLGEAQFVVTEESAVDFPQSLVILLGGLSEALWLVLLLLDLLLELLLDLLLDLLLLLLGPLLLLLWGELEETSGSPASAQTNGFFLLDFTLDLGVDLAGVLVILGVVSVTGN